MAITACTIVATYKGLGKHEVSLLSITTLTKMMPIPQSSRVHNEDPHPPSHTLLIFEDDSRLETISRSSTDPMFSWDILSQL